jgi:hypothetical protein
MDRSESSPAAVAALDLFAKLAATVSSPLSLAAALHTSVCDGVNAQTVSICLLRPDGETLELIEPGLYPTEVATPWSTFPLDAHLPASEVVRTGMPMFLTREELVARFPLFRDSPTLGSGAIGIVPIGSRGALVAGFANPEPVATSVRQLLAELAELTQRALSRLS